MINKNELWDIYDEHRIKTGRVQKRGDKMQLGDYHVTVHVCIFNSKNQLLIQQRQPSRVMFPNMWDISAAGCVLAGENSMEGAKREVHEELGLSIDFSNIRPSFTINFDTGFDDYYFVECDCEIENLKLQPEEVCQAKWVNRDEVLKLKEEGKFIPYWFLDKLWQIKNMRGAF